MEEKREEVHIRIEDALHPVNVPVLQDSDFIAKASEAFRFPGVATL